MSFPQGQALVQTVDFLTPTVNDPYRFGRIAAANALSDVYAMGGTPWSAMNIVCFPAKKLPMDVLTEVLRGGRDAVEEAGAVSAGGHSVEDDEIKYGLAVSGLVDPDRIASNRGVQPGDHIVLTKPIGTGVLSTAVKGEMTGSGEMEETLFQVCGRLNRGGGEAIQTLGLTGATDITGFGLGGHLVELAEASKVTIELDAAAVPLIPGTFDLAAMGMMPAGSICNRNFYAAKTTLRPELDPILADMMFDAQTSGGLALAIPQDKLDDAISLLATSGDLAACIGTARISEDGDTPLSIL